MEEKSSYLGNEKFESIMRKNYEIYTLGAAIILGRVPRTVNGQSWMFIKTDGLFNKPFIVGDKIRASLIKEMCATGLNLPFDYFKVRIHGLGSARFTDQAVRGYLIIILRRCITKNIFQLFEFFITHRNF